MAYTRNLIWAILAMTILGLISCQSSPDVNFLRSEILELHQKMIDAHWNKDVDFMAKDISDNYFFITNGEILYPTKDEIIYQFNDYFNKTEFSEYKDLCEPIIGFSQDGSLAWSIAQVQVAGERMLADNSIRGFNTTWAWMTLYERQGDKWIRLGEVSNFKQ